MTSIGNIKNIHFVGIGGISMSALAEITLHSGYTVTGSDRSESHLTNRLRERGAQVYIGHAAENVENAEMVVYTAAVKNDNPELMRARERAIPVIDRAQYIGLLMKGYSYGIAIAGCHGKTTTTSMVSIIFQNAQLDPTIMLGGELNAINGNVRVGKSDYFITEACEYYESFLRFSPFVGAILNIEADHLDYFGSLDNIIIAFKKFAELIPAGGSLVVCNDNEQCVNIAQNLPCKLLTYGIKNKGDFYIENISYDDWARPTFDAYFRGEYLGSFSLGVPGYHNASNALAAIAISINAGISIDVIKESLREYTGTARRFELKGIEKDILVIDDYAHHPTAILSTLGIAKLINKGRVWCVFQPHTYTRTIAFREEFIASFDDAHRIIITDIYAAREAFTDEIHASHLVDGIKSRGGNAAYLNSFEEIAELIAREAQPRDLVLTIGAGSITELGPMILDKLKNIE